MFREKVKTQPCWSKLMWKRVAEGEYGVSPETFGDLRMMLGNRHQLNATPAQRATFATSIERLFRSLPEGMLEVWPWETMTIPTQLTKEPYDHWRIQSNSGLFMSIRSTTKARYQFLLDDVKGDTDFMLYPLMLAQQAGVNIKAVRVAKIWSSLKPARGVVMPKAVDLMWKLLHDKNHLMSGQQWMVGKEVCPMCSVPQLPKHLLWDCPSAKAVWGDMTRLWGDLTKTPRPHIRNFESAQIECIWKRKLSHSDKRRWTIFHSEVFWSIWVFRCKWAFDEVKFFDTPGLLAFFRYRIRMRMLMDRQVALGHGYGSIDEEMFSLVWGRKAADKDIPDFL